MKYTSWDKVEKVVMNEQISRRVITGERAMVAQITLARGAVVPRHQHEAEQLSYVMKGALEFEMDGETVTVRAGEVLRVPSNVPHGAVALEATLNFEVFAPPRPDWLPK